MYSCLPKNEIQVVSIGNQTTRFLYGKLKEGTLLGKKKEN